MAVQSGSIILESDVNSYINVSKGNPIYASDVNSYVNVSKGNPIYASEMNRVINILNTIEKRPIGGKIFYDAGDNGATYFFYDSNNNIISDTSISGLQSAVSYAVYGTPSSDRFYAVYPDMLDRATAVYWGFYRNVDIMSSGGNIVNTGTGIGTGKTATQAILNYINTYAPRETASKNRPNSNISQSSHGSYNLYKNCGRQVNYLWDVIRDANNNSLGGHNDWFVPSKDEMKQIGTSGVISDITNGSKHHLWSGSADSNAGLAWYWNWSMQNMDNYSRFDYDWCLACRAF